MSEDAKNVEIEVESSIAAITEAVVEAKETKSDENNANHKSETKAEAGLSKNEDIEEVESNDLEDIDLDNDLDLRITKIHIQTILDTINKQLNGRSLTKGNIIHVTYACLSMTKRLKTGKVYLPNKLKKQVLLAALRQHLKNDKNLSDNDRELLMLMVSDVIDTGIDVLVTANASNSGCCIIT